MIILASRSKARQKILRDLGVRFRVIPSRVKERRHAKVKPAATVRLNALLKARDVAGRLRHGIVLACDTLVWQRGKVFGKPRDLRDARRMLGLLSSRPHELFTGIAIIDAASKKELVDVEKTRIEMTPLTDIEISRYFRKVSPLDKAGSFDIQGRGGLFIRRIEGCYFNVVGLPVSKMFCLLKKMGVTLLSVLILGMFFGCATEFNPATGKQDLMMYSTDQEVNIGRSVAVQVDKQFKTVLDPAANERVSRIGARIAAVCDRREIFYRFAVIEDEKDPDLLNAVSLPGGYVYVFTYLLKVAESDDELAAVLGHEVAHIVARHSIKRLQAQWGYNALTALAVGTGNTDMARGVQLAYVSLFSAYSQEDELLADREGALYAQRAGYDPGGMITFLEKMRKIEKKEPARPLSYFRTHPYIADRIRAAKSQIGQQISFEDFINTY